MNAKPLLSLLLGLLTLPVQAQTVEYIHTDALGTPVAVTDAAGNVIERSEYEPYGQLLNRPITDGPGYTGHVSDSATGLSYMQQRYYDPMIGRFLSVDPVLANTSTGRNFNRYKYASNSPYKFVDPDGRADLNAFHASDHHGLFLNAANDLDLPGTFTLGAHANEEFFSNQKDGDFRDVSYAADVFKYAQTNGLKTGQKMFLAACETGLPSSMGALPLAQQLADMNRSSVTAPNGFVNYDRKGDTTTLTVWTGRNKTGRQGEWVSFAPGGQGAGSSTGINKVLINHKTGSVTVQYGTALGTRVKPSQTFTRKEKIE